MSIGQLIRDARKRAGLTQKELAEKAGIATGTIQQYELGKRQPRLVQLEKIAFALETTVSKFVENDYWAKVSKTELDESWEANIPFYVDPEKRIANAISLMNKEGKNKVADYAIDILPNYRAQSIPQSPPAPQEGQSTSPPPAAPETAPQGK